jgi:hypothetical protein
MRGSRPLIEPHDTAAITTTTMADVGGAEGGQGDGSEMQSPIDAFFAGTRWRRDDVIVVLAGMQLLLLLIRLYILMRNDNAVIGGIALGTGGGG